MWRRLHCRVLLAWTCCSYVRLRCLELWHVKCLCLLQPWLVFVADGPQCPLVAYHAN